MSQYLAAYDITSARDRRAVARILMRYGHRVQLSVFEVWLDPEDWSEFRRQVGGRLAASDLFDLYPIDARATRARVRWQRAIEPAESVIFV